MLMNLSHDGSLFRKIIWVFFLFLFYSVSDLIMRKVNSVKAV